MDLSVAIIAELQWGGLRIDILAFNRAVFRAKTHGTYLRMRHFVDKFVVFIELGGHVVPVDLSVASNTSALQL
jgi:hypothetical protein